MKKIILIIYLITTIFAGIYSQDKSKIKEYFIEAEYYLLYEDYLEALPFYLKIDNSSYTNANIKYRIGMCYLYSDLEKHKSITYLENASKNITREYNEGSFRETKAPEAAHYFLAKAYRINNKLDKAIEAYEKFINTLSEKEITNIFYVNQEIKSCQNAKALQQIPVFFELENLGEVINNRFSNKNPVISHDEEFLIYTSKQKFYDAVFFSKKINGEWSAPMNLTPQIGSDGDFYPSSISYDKKTLILFKDDVFGGELYYSKYDDELGVWSKAEKFNKNINTKFWETHACLSPDEQTLYFTSNRKDGYGGLDIYISKRDENGDWGPAINLGPSINTPYNEETPFITANGKRLYFSSQGHYNIGGFDILYATRTGINKWSKPLNLGYPINTTDNDLFFVPTNNGQTAYVSKKSDRGMAVTDIYKAYLVDEIKQDIIKINGLITLLDNVDEFVDNFSIIIINSETNDTVAQLVPGKNNGQYTIDLPIGKYKFIVNGEGYEKKIEEIIIDEDFARNQLTVNTELTPTSVIEGKYIIIKSIYFYFDDFSLTRDAKIELEKLFVVMNEYPDLKIEVIGHTDSLGPIEYNMWLSEKRANSAINYLVKKGINRNRFVATGKGETSPVAVNFNVEGRRLNRRVEIKVLSSGGEKIISQLYFIPEHLKIIEQEYYYIIISNAPDKIDRQKIQLLKELELTHEHEVINNNHVYYIGTFKEKSEAIKLFNNIISMGFGKAQIISNTEFDNLNK